MSARHLQPLRDMHAFPLQPHEWPFTLAISQIMQSGSKLGVTSIFMLPRIMSNRFDVIRGNMNMDVSPYMVP